jgi:hypothetical protein
MCGQAAMFDVVAPEDEQDWSSRRDSDSGALVATVISSRSPLVSSAAVRS